MGQDDKKNNGNIMIDFMDFGCGDGSSINWAKRFGGNKGWGVEKNSDKIKDRFDIINGDITKDIYLPRVRYTTMLHLLEHLYSEVDVEYVIKKAITHSSEFVFIKCPFFEKIEYLADLGFKITWTDWLAHSTAITEKLLSDILNKTGLDYYIGFQYPIEDSQWKEIIPKDAPVDTIWYSESLGKKEYVKFDEIYREIYCYINTGNIKYWDKLLTTNIL